MRGKSRNNKRRIARKGNNMENIGKIIKHADAQTKKEIKIILDSFTKWSDVYTKAIIAGNETLDLKLLEISSRTAEQVSLDSILLVSESTIEGTLNNTFLATLLLMKKRQVS